MIKKINSSDAPKAIGPYSQATILKDLVFTSGQIGLNLEGKIAGDDITSQTKQVFKNLEAVLKAAGTSAEKVLKAEVFLTNLADFEIVNQLFADFFGEHKPARTTIQVANLPKNAKVEIALTASLVA